jgi:ubiquinone/menaquinone biosynthesis C-methylase UbiE
MLRVIAANSLFLDCSLYGILPSAPEVDLAREKLKERNEWCRISLLEGDSTSIPLSEGSQDRVYMNQMFHLLSPELAVSSLREVRRILRPGGALFIGALPDKDEFSNHKQDHTAMSWFNANVLHSSGYRQRVIDSLRCLRYAITRRPFVQLLRTPYFCAPPEFKALLESEEFKDVKFTPYMVLDASGQAFEHGCRWDYLAIR